MHDYTRFYINGAWVEPAGPERLDVENPATGQPIGRIALGSPADVDLAVRAARAAFPAWAETSREDRLAALERITAEYHRRSEDLAAAVTAEMGAPIGFARTAQVPVGLGHLAIAVGVLKDYSFEQPGTPTTIVKEPIGVCAFITPWNWPLNQILCKVAPALATGCTMILKPSEVAPISATIFAEIVDAAGLPPGVCNLVHGGPGVGAALATHPDIDMISFTGSTRAGIEVARAAAHSVKRVHQELGGKSAAIILDDAALSANVAQMVGHLMMNSGQSCNAPSRLLVPELRRDDAVVASRASAESMSVGDPTGDAALGPVVSRTQWDRIQRLIEAGVAEGATLVTGGVGYPEGLDAGHYVRPTVFAGVTPDMTIAREEIFGPVIVIMTYTDLDDAVRIANATEYGLAGYVSGEDLGVVRNVARRLRAGQVAINGASDLAAPFGGYRMSGNGREWGRFAFDEFLEVKALIE